MRRLMAFSGVLAGILIILCFGCPPADASNLVTGNGFGFVVVSRQTAAMAKFYAHPYSFVRPDPKDSLSEGIATTNFIQSLSWGGETATGTAADYEDDSQIIRARNSMGEGTFFMPFGLRQAALILNWRSAPGKTAHNGWSVTWSHPVHSQRALQVSGSAAELLQFDGIDESLLLIPLAPLQAQPAFGQEALGGSRSWALISLEPDANPEQALRDFNRWRNRLAPLALEQREIAELERWRVQPAVHFTSDKERHLWRQSEVMLRIAQCREPNRPGSTGDGLIVASLPDGVWFTPWVRDMAYATVALARMGHRDEARAAVLAYFNARPTGKMRAQTAGADYQISVVRYFGDGSEEPFFT